MKKLDRRNPFALARHIRIRLFPASLISMFLCSFALLTQAANSVWNGSTDGNVNTAGNWTPSGVPAANSTLEFPTGVTQTLVTNNLTATRAYSGVTFDAGATGYVLNGNSVTVTLAGNGVTNNSGNPQTVNWQFRVYNGAASGAAYFNAASGALALGGGFNTGSSGIGWIATLGSGGVTLNGGIPASCGVSNINGTLTLGAPSAFTVANAYTNNSYVVGGTLKLGASGVIPNGGGKGNVVLQPASGTATFDVAGQTNTINGLNSGGAGTSIVDNSTGTGLLVVGSADTNSTFSGVIQNSSGTLALTKIGLGTFTLNGADTYTGNTTISNGTLALGASGSLSSSTVNINAGSTFDVSAQASFTWSGSGGVTANGTGTGVGSTASTIKGGTSVNLGSAPVTLNYTPTTFFGDLTHPVAYVSAGSLTLNGAVTVVNNGASPLSVGSYLLISQASGSISGSPTLNTVTGQGLATQTAGGLVVNSGSVFMVVTSTAPLSATATLTRHAGTVASTTYGDALSFDVSMNPSSATGMISLKDDSGVVLGTGTLSAGACTITPALNALIAGTHTNITANYGGDNNYGSSVSAPLSTQTVAQKVLTVATATANNKDYDATTAATITGTLSGVVSGDTVTYGTGTFAAAAPGTGIAVTALPALGGASAANYVVLTVPTGLTANIYAGSAWGGGAADTLWNTVGNWTNNIVPLGYNVTADFSTLDILSDTTVNLDKPVSIGNLIFGDIDNTSPANWFLANNGVATNILTLAGSSPTITVEDLGAGYSATISTVVTGTNGLIKQGAGVLNLTSVNTYTGSTTIAGGQLSIGSSGSLNSGLYSGSISNNGTLQLGSSTVQYLSGPITGTGNLILNGSSTVTLAASNTYSGTTALLAGTLVAATNSALSTNMLTLDVSAKRLDVTGGATLVNPITINAANPGTGNAAINGADASTTTINGAISINAGTSHIGNSSTGTIVVNGPITATVPVQIRKGYVYLNGGGSYTTLDLNQDNLELGADNGICTQAVLFVASIASRTGTLYLNGHAQTLAGLQGPAGGSIGSINGSNTNSSVLTLDEPSDSAYAGTIVGTNLSLIKNGPGNQILAGTNTYQGNTTINAGALTLTTGLIPNTRNITIAGGALLDVSAVPGWTLGAAQTLGGSGTVNGSAIINGTLALGNAITNFTFNNDLTLAGTNIMKITKAGGLTNDVVVVGGNFTEGGTLQVVLTGATALAVNDSFTFYNFATAPAGSFTQVVLPAAYTWDTSQLATTGTIKVTGVVAPPSFSRTTVSGGNIILTGSGGIAGNNYYLLSATNLTPPVVWLPVLTNAFDVSGNFSNAIPVNATVPETFYRLQLP